MTAPMPTENWSKPYILQVHKAAVDHGFVWIQPIDEADAASFKARFYRIRRRSDKSMASFIPPEFHMVNVGAWEIGPTGQGRLPIIYSARPDGKPLPDIIPATQDEITYHQQMPAMPAPEPSPEIDPRHLDPAAIEIKEEDISGLVERLRKSARSRDQ